MDLKELVSISGKPGIYKIIARSPKGYVVESVDEQKKRLSINASQQVAILEEITVYVKGEESIPLKDVFLKFKESTVNIPEPKADNTTLKTFFNEVVPENDSVKVYASDIKKMVKWFISIKEFLPEILNPVDTTLEETKELIDENLESEKEPESEENNTQNTEEPKDE